MQQLRKYILYDIVFVDTFEIMIRIIEWFYTWSPTYVNIHSMKIRIESNGILFEFNQAESYLNRKMLIDNS